MISIQKLSKTYSKLQVVKSINLEIPDNNIFALLGPNGSGKTTLLKCILGLVFPDKESKLEIDNVDIAFKKPEERNMSYMPQVPLFPNNLRVKDIIEFLIKIGKKEPKHHTELMDELHIHDFYDKQFGKLSGGMKQKVNILQCFMYETKLAIVDEPTASVDPQTSYFFKKYLKKRRELGQTILITSHIMSEVEELADKLAILVEGELIGVDTPQNFITKNQSTNLEDAVRKYWLVRK
ncbi:MAG: ABC transporter ATP-binding protein [Leptospiraceae bacterium]|nr:ABC transporter ATP-binding protein [Leptospiraceae bacterium]